MIDVAPAKRGVAMVFQSYALYPHMTVAENVTFGLRMANHPKRDTEQRCLEAARMLKLEELLDRKPSQLSGGQRQRINIARALAVAPDFLVCDESVAALDVSIQAQVINLFMRLREELGLTYLFISHDMPVIQHVCKRIAVMYKGQIVETGSRDEILKNPQHKYTQSLLSAVPEPDPRRVKQRVIFEGGAM